MLHEQFSANMFIKRTKKIIEQYKEKLSSCEDDYYDVTLSINCLYGLLMMAYKKNQNTISKKEARIYLTENGINENEIGYESKLKLDSSNIQITFDELIRGIRNGLAHWEESNSSYKSHVEFVSNNQNIVNKVIIIGQIVRNKTTIEPRKEIIIKVELFITDTSENSIVKLIRLI